MQVLVLLLSAGHVWSQPVLLGPADGSTDLSWEVELRAFVAGATVFPEVTFHAQPASAAVGPQEDFTIVVVPDTQNYLVGLGADDPSLFKEQIDWIAANRAALNIVYVSHVGDIVFNYNDGNEDEWAHAADAMYRLEDPVTTGLAEGIPYGVLPGNHDITGLDSTVYNQYFGPAHFAGRAYYGASATPGNNDNYYTLFEAGALRFLHFNIMWEADMDVVGPWMQTVAATYPDRLLFVTTHHACGPGNPSAFTATGQAIYDTLKSNPNFFMLQGGHQFGDGRRVDTFEGNEVHTILSNYQHLPNGGDGYLRLYRFSPSQGTIEATTYSPVLDANMDGESAFTINKNFDAWLDVLDAPVVATFSNVFNASTLSPVFDAAPGTEYQWYVTAGGQRSPVRTFATEANLAPLPTAPPTLVVDEGSQLTHTLVAQDPNQTAQALSWSLLSGPAALQISPQGQLSWLTAEADGPGVFTIQAQVADDAPQPATAQVDFSVTVNEVNQAPQLSLTALPAQSPLPATNAYLTADVGAALSLSATGSDADLPANTLVYSFASGQVPGMQLDAATGQFSWTPSAAHSARRFPLVFRVEDNGSPLASAVAAVDLIVTEDGRLALQPNFVRTSAAGQDYQIVWPSFPGYLYGLETRSDVVSAWQDLGTLRASGPSLSFGEILSGDPRPHGQYRLRLLSK